MCHWQGGCAGAASPTSSSGPAPPAKASDDDSAASPLRVAAHAALDGRDDAMPSTPDQTPAHTPQRVASGVVRFNFARLAAVTDPTRSVCSSSLDIKFDTMPHDMVVCGL